MMTKEDQQRIDELRQEIADEIREHGVTDRVQKLRAAIWVIDDAA